jgi:hypothetical protein
MSAGEERDGAAITIPYPKRNSKAKRKEKFFPKH